MLSTLAFAQTHLDNELYNSALLISHTLPITNPRNAYIIIKSLYYLNHFKKIQIILEKHTDLLSYKEILFYYIKSGNPEETTLCRSIFQEDKDKLNVFSFNIESLTYLYNGLCKKDSIRKKYFIESYQADPRNMEPLYFLISESLCSIDEIHMLASRTDYYDLVRRLFNSKSQNRYYSPLVFHIQSIFLYNKNMLNDLFRLSVKAINEFPNSEFSHASLGLFYLARKRYINARNCYKKAVEINNNFGFGYLGKGIAEVFLLETGKGMTFLWKAHDIMDCLYFPAYFLAYEYEQMNNYNKAKYFYTYCIENILKQYELKRTLYGENKNVLNRHDIKVISSVVYCFIYNENYEDGLELLHKFKINNLLNVYCYLFMDNIEKAEKAIEKCGEEVLLHGTRGYLLHLLEDFDGAIKEYEKCIARNWTSAVESLMIMAMQNRDGRALNKAFDYSNSLFNELEYKNRSLPYYI